jgi:hypothetical protein
MQERKLWLNVEVEIPRGEMAEVLAEGTSKRAMKAAIQAWTHVHGDIWVTAYRLGEE